MGNFQDKVLEEGSEGEEEVFIRNGPKETAQFLVNSLVEDSRRIDIDTNENSNNLTKFQSLWIVENLLKYGFPFTFRHDPLEEASIFRQPLGFNKRKQAKRDFTLIAIAIFSASDELKEFWEMYNEYSEGNILKLYLKKGHIYKALNYSLQTSITCSIQYCRLILKDLTRAITSKYLSSADLQHNGLLYSEIYVTPEKWSQLESHIGYELKVDRFFSATKSKQNSGNNSKENLNKKVRVTIVMLGPPSRTQKEEIQGFLQLENGNDILFNLDSKFTILDATDRRLLLLYGKYEILKYLQQAQPNIAVKRTNIYQKKCSQCQALYESLQGRFFFVDLIDQDYFVCSACLIPQAGRRTPLLLISSHIEQNMTPDGSEDPALHLPGLIINYPDDVAIPFYGYKCADCDQEGLTDCLKCVTCCSPHKEWCISADCQLAMGECLDKGHNIILERSPFTYWPRKPPAAGVQNNNPEDETLEVAQYFNENFHYEEVLEHYTLKDVVLIANSYCIRGCQYFEEEKYQTAKEFHLKALDVRKYLYGNKKHAHVAISYNNLGQCCFMLGEIDEAFDYHRKAFEIRNSVFGQDHFATADSLNNLGMIHFRTDYTTAVEKVSQALDIRRRKYSYPHEKNAIYNNNLATIYSAWGPGHENEAETHYLKAQEIWKSLGKARSLPIAKSYLGLGVIYKNKKEYKKASDFIFKALEILKTYQLPSCELKIAEGFASLGDLNKSQNKYTEAIEEYKEALGYYERSQGDNNTAIGMAYKNLGEIYFKLERYDEARDYYLLAKEWYEKNSNSGLIASRFDELGFAFKRLFKYRDAKQMFKIAIEIKEKHFGENNLLTKQSKNNLQDLLSLISS